MTVRALSLAGAILCGTFISAGDAAMTACRSTNCINLVFDGDSISAGTGATRGFGLDVRVAAALGDPVVLHNIAVGGRPVSDCLRLYQDRVAPLLDESSEHNVIAFHAGDNDIAQGRNAAQTYAAFTEYVFKAHRQGWKVVVSTEFPRPDFSPAKEQELEDYNRQLRRNDAGADAVVDFVADRRIAVLSYRANPTLFSHDGIHPSDGGYALLTNMLVPAVAHVAGR